jgi:two-component system response regulator RegX3
MASVLRTLVVDDEEQIRFFLRETLRREGHVVTAASSGEEALEILQDTPFDLALLDLMLGGRVDGQRLLEAIRWRWPRMVVVMITAHGTLESAVQAIQEGVDGYLLKPVKADEVRAAVRQALERREKRAELQVEGRQSVLQRGPFSVHLESHEVTRDGISIDLTPSELKLLVHLMQNAGKVIPPGDLVEAVRQYRPEYAQEARQVIKWYIHRLRRKVEPDPSVPRYVVNVRGAGYIFEP